jgi:hypothetical protein
MRALPVLLAAAALAADAAPVSAQFVGGGFASRGPTIPGINFYYYNRFGASVSSGLGPGISYSYSLYGPIGYGMAQRFNYFSYTPFPYGPRPNNPTFLGQSSYMSGGLRAPTDDATQRAFAQAQRQAAQMLKNPAARTAIYDQWAYEKLGVMGLPAVKSGDDAPAALQKALANAGEAEITSGDALNHIVVGIVAAEKKARADSAFLPPNLVAHVRFAGPPAAEAINLLRQVGTLTFPAVLDDVAFAAVRPALEKDLAAAAAPVLLGKAADGAKVAALEADVMKARAILEPITRNFDFTDATAARRFLNQLDAAISVLKTPGSANLIDPRWSTEGTSVSDLVRHLEKNKMLFGAAPKGQEDSYFALHRGLAAYLIALTESAKPAPKK